MNPFRFMDRTYASKMYTGSGFGNSMGNPMGTATVYPSATSKKSLTFIFLT